MNYRLGIDVGGTNTDAVILDSGDTVVAKCKRPTTQDISTGIKEAVESVLQESGVDPKQILHAMHTVYTSMQRKENRHGDYGDDVCSRQHQARDDARSK